MRVVVAAIAVLLGTAACAPGLAQQVTLEASPALRCLTPPASVRGAPEYPFDAWKRRQPGRVKVALVFTGADLAPAVEVLENEGDREFVDAVRAHARDLRVPCLNDVGGTARLEFEFLFRPDLRQVVWNNPQDAADPGRRLMLRCVGHVSRERKPDYPISARREGVQGRVLALLRFESADRPPQVQVFARRNARRLESVVEEWAKGYRMPCYQGAPIEAVWTFLFTFEGEAGYGFRAIDLMQYLSAVKGIRQQTLAFDTRAMGCPFDLRLSYRRPELPNVIGEVGSHDPARRPLLQWLADSELDLPGRTLDSVYGDTAELHVPCLRLDLKPKE